MPLVYHKELSGGWLALWRIDESTERLSELAGSDAAKQVEGFRSELRKRQRLAWRALLRDRLSEDIEVEYNDLGAPVLPEGKGFIGVSHERGLASVIYSRNHLCAVDVESLERDFGRVAERYISADEMLLNSGGSVDFLAAVWCAKEVLYKSGGRQGLDLLDDIRISKVDFDSGTILGAVNGEKSCEMEMFKHEGSMVVYTRLK